MAIRVCIILFFATQAFADTINVPGESAHVASGIIVAGAAAAVADKYYPEHRALIGFSVSVACAVIGEGIDMIHTGEKISSSLQDVAFQTIGAAIGAAMTDKYILMPIIKHDNAERAYFGLTIQHRF